MSNQFRPTKLRIEHLIEREPWTSAQKDAFKSYKAGQHLALMGAAGTGKTFIATYLALEEVLDKNTPYEKIVFVRSAVPTRDMGFLPGTLEEKEEAYKAPYKAIVEELFNESIAWDKLVNDKKIEYLTTSYIRGLTIKNAIVIIDEAQNCNYHELCSIITRLGEDTKILVCGDHYQSDFRTEKDKEGLNGFLYIIRHMKYFDIINCTWEDIVRSGLVRDFLMTKDLVDQGKL